MRASIPVRWLELASARPPRDLAAARASPLQTLPELCDEHLTCAARHRCNAVVLCLRGTNAAPSAAQATRHKRHGRSTGRRAGGEAKCGCGALKGPEEVAPLKGVGLSILLERVEDPTLKVVVSVSIRSGGDTQER